MNGRTSQERSRWLKKLAGTWRRGHGTSGESLIEFALVLPLWFLLIGNAVNFGGMLYAWIALSNAARTGTDYMVRDSATVCFMLLLVAFAGIEFHRRCNGSDNGTLIRAKLVRIAAQARPNSWGNHSAPSGEVRGVR